VAFRRLREKIPALGKPDHVIGNDTKLCFGPGGRPHSVVGERKITRFHFFTATWAFHTWSESIVRV
jgi:hypothetical protein